MRALGNALTLLVLSSLTACGATQAEPGSPFEGTAGSEEVLVTVENNDFRDATVYLYWSGLRTRAGSVLGKDTETFRMDWKSEWVHFGVEFLGGGGYETETVAVDPGDHLNFVIMASP